MKMFARKNQVVGGIGKCMINRSLYERQIQFNYSGFEEYT